MAKITLKDRKSGEEIQVEKTAYTMRKHKYDQTHTIVNRPVPTPTPEFVKVFVAPEPEMPTPETTQVVSEEKLDLSHTDAQTTVAAPKERAKPGPKPKVQGE